MSAPDAWDLVVVGAGPAGAATALGALHAAPGLRVLLLDRADFPRDKPCGDGIAPHVLDALAEVGVRDAADGWAPVARLHITRGPDGVERPMVRPTRVIPRRVFDARLVEHAVAAGAELRRHRVRAVAPADDGGDVVVDGTVRARVLVGADGPRSVVRPAVGAPPGRRALAIRGYAPTPSGRAGLQVIAYGDRRQPSYAWSFDRGDGLANVGYGELIDAGTAQPAPSRALLLAELERLLPGATDGGADWAAHHLPLSGWPGRRSPTAWGGRVLLAGDAAGLVNPMTGEGIYYAVATGLLAGRAAATGDPARAGRDYRTATRDLLAAHQRHTTAASRLSASPRVVSAGIAASRRSQRVFDDLVEIGLGRGRITPRLGAGLLTSLVPRPRTTPEETPWRS